MSSPTISFIACVRHADASLRRFLGGLAGQDLQGVELVLVGLPGVAAADVTAALRAAGLTGAVIESASGDVAAARRLGLAHAGGRWVSFPQADDAPAANYVASAVRAIAEHEGDVDAFVMPRRSSTGRSAASPRRTRVIPGEEAEFPSDVTRTLYRRETTTAESAPALDSHADPILALDLLRSSPRRIAVVGGTHYARHASSGLDPQSSWLRADGDRYRALLRGVTRRLLDATLDPALAGVVVTRVLRRLVGFEFSTTTRATVFDESGGEEFRRLLAECLRLIDAAPTRDLPDAPPRFDEVGDVVRALAGSLPRIPAVAHVLAIDPLANLMEVRYDVPAGAGSEEFAVAGAPVGVQHGKLRAVEALGSVPMRQRIAWVEADARLRLRVEGVEVPIRFASGAPLPTAGDARGLLRARADEVSSSARTARRKAIAASGGGLRRRLLGAVRRARRGWLSRAAAVRLLARLPWVAGRYRDAWTFMDRADVARDNAEHLYRWVRAHRPDINAWFVLRADSSDYGRLRQEGFRLVPYGSTRHHLLLHRTRNYLSSHVGIDVNRPIFDRYLMRKAPWTFTFLQHGVIHNDLSMWLNRQRIRLFVASTHDEFAGIAGDGSPYVFTDRELQLTGLPRFDRLRAIADDSPPDSRRTIVIAPTWRSGLFEAPEGPGRPRRPKPGFLESPFIRSLLGILNHPVLATLAHEGFQVVFVPHPNLAPAFPYDRIPAHVSVSSYDSADVQQLLGTAAVFLTDYSSVAFDAAFADARVVYMHLDDRAIYGVDHTLFPGYFDFERDGFGPVCRTVDDTMDAVVRASRAADPVHAARARAAFAHRDAKNCERVFERVIALDAGRAT